MALHIPKRVVLNWYQYDVSFSAELINTFVESIEKQASESMVNYEKTTKSDVVDGQMVYVHQGLESDTWDLATVFGEYFPSLQRRSALLTVCSYFEHELDQLCLLYQSEKSFRLALSDLNGKGIDRSISYLEKVAGLYVHRASPVWKDIKNIQKIRNLIVHGGGRLRDNHGNPKTDIAGVIKQMRYLSGDDEIVLANGFLSYVVGTYRKYFELINQSIKSAQNVPQAHSSSS
jgi:hypothetical protein